MKYFIYYLIIINIIGLIIYGVDKLLAVLKKNRVSERFLYFLSFIGGGLGCLIGMLLFRHKTKKKRFYFWNILMILLWCYIIYEIM